MPWFCASVFDVSLTPGLLADVRQHILQHNIKQVKKILANDFSVLADYFFLGASGAIIKVGEFY